MARRSGTQGSRLIPGPSLAKSLWLRVRQTAVAMVILSGLTNLVYAQIPGPVNLQGTGGTISVNGNTVTHTFDDVGTINFVPPPGTLDVLVVGGGGGGGRGGAGAGGGGGGGAVVQQLGVTVSGTVSVTVGGGGAGGTGASGTAARGAAGSSSSFGAISAAGGGAGGSGQFGTSTDNAAARAGGPGASGGGGGGGGADNQNGTAGSATAGTAGGAGAGAAANQASRRAGGGGGGAGSAGFPATRMGNDGRGGNGGNGVSSSISGTATTYGGGGGGANTSAGYAQGGLGGGGNGSDDANATAGGPGTGGGGGGARNGNGGAGGSGIVIVRYQRSTLRVSTQPTSETLSGQPLVTQPAVRVLNSAGNPVNGVTVTASIHSGSPTLSGAVTAQTDDQGYATFTDLTLTGTEASAALLRFSVAGDVNTNYVVSNPVEIVDTGFYIEISHNTGGGTCAANPVTITVYNAQNQVAVDFEGQITITASPGIGNWSNVFGGSGVFDNGTLNDGIATYTFHTNDNGVVQLGFTAAANGYTFNVTGPDIDSVNDNGGTLTISACQFRIFHGGDGNVCAVDEITIRVTNTQGIIVTGFTGTVNLSTSSGAGPRGDWTKTTVAGNALGPLTPNGSNTGAAQYTFVAADQGEIVLNYQTIIPGTVNFNVTSQGAAVAAPSGAYDPDLIITACTFRISHTGISDVCSIAEVTVTLVDGNGAVVTNYTGTINLNTTTHYGTWVDIGDGYGALTDPVAEDGSATYKFETDDQGSVIFGFRHTTTSGTVNIDVSDGLSQDLRNPASAHDQNITIALCTFAISHAGESNACSITAVTFTVLNRQGNVATDYVGTMRITNNTSRGDWHKAVTAAGALTAPSGTDVGIADYTFLPADAGTVVLNFHSTYPATINFDVIDGVIVENGALDPDLFYSGCLPKVFSAPSCTNPGTSTSITIPAQNERLELRSRAVLLATMQVGNTGNAANVSATFAGKSMTRVARIDNTNSGLLGGVSTEIWVIFDEEIGNLAAGSYNVSYSGTFTNTPAICALVVEGIAQIMPVPAGAIGTPAAAAGPVNGSISSEIVDGFITSNTEISAEANNSLIFSVVANNRSVTSNAANFWRPAQPSNALNELWGGTVIPNQPDPPYRQITSQANPVNGKSAGSAGVLSSAGVIEVVERYQTTLTPSSPSSWGPSAIANVAAAFEPFVASMPLAESYEPVVLYETLSGPVSYRAIGSSRRRVQSTLVPQTKRDCTILDVSADNEVVLQLPEGSTVRAAYLYWAGSGKREDADTEVMFGPAGNKYAVVAADVFMAEGLADQGDADFFGAYANVTDLVTQEGLYQFSDLEVQVGSEWLSSATCAGGWTLVVVYENNDEHMRVINLFHGFQPFQHSSFTLVPRNFRMATYDEAMLLPNGQVTHVTIEGDEALATGNESLGIQVEPGALTFESLFTSFNPVNGEFNSTITRPLYWLGPTGYYEFVMENPAPSDPCNNNAVPFLGINCDGYELDFRDNIDLAPEPPEGEPELDEDVEVPEAPAYSWGFDIDTHYLSHTLLEDFAQPGLEAERITTRYRSGQDLVILMSEIISVTNFPIADLEVFLTPTSTFKVNGTGSYTVSVVNNGNGSSVDGDATGMITAAMRLPTGMTFANAGDVGGSGWVCDVVLSPAAFTCNYNIATTWPGAELPSGASLPPINLVVQLGNHTAFPLQNNLVKTAVRILHHGGSCGATPVGYIPDPASCVRSPQFDNKNDTQGGTIDIDSMMDKTPSNNNLHSVNTAVSGLLADLRMQKAVVDTFEKDKPGQYLLTVTNLGPDATTTPFSIIDIQPPGVVFTGTAGANWSCSTLTPVLNCTYAEPLAVNESAVLTLDVDVTGNGGFSVTNTAQVLPGTGNFDPVVNNNASTVVTRIVAAPVPAQERFLLSVSTPGDATTIADLGPFSNQDLIIYDPFDDSAVMFFSDDEMNEGRIDDINAVHLLKNGHILMSANGQSTVGSNDLVFDPWDIVRYDPILGTAEMFLDGESVFQDHEQININDIYVMDDCSANNNNLQCSIVLTTTAGGVVGSNNLTFTASDLVILCRNSAGCPDYGLQQGEAAMYLEGSDLEVFGPASGNGTVDIDAFYLKVDPADPKAVLDVFYLSVDNESAVLGEELDPDPLTGTVLTRDDVARLDLEAGTTEAVFVGDLAPGIFEPADPLRRLDALHLIEDGYFGHFSIQQVESGSVCEAGVLRVSKHDGLAHSPDLDYYGSVRLSTSTNYGTWQLQSGNGLLIDEGNGKAVYTYASSDQGAAIFRLVHNQTGIVNVSATNGIAREVSSEDPNFSYDPSLTMIVWGDDFSSAGFSGKTEAGFLPMFANAPESRNWKAGWVEKDRLDGTDGSGLGANVGNIQVVDGRLRISSSTQAASANNRPEISRVFDVSAVPVSEPLLLHVGYSHTTLSTNAKVILEARGDSDEAWLQVQLFENMTFNNSNSTIPITFDLSDILDTGDQSWSNNTEIRFRVSSGLELSDRYFYVDYVLIESATDQCGFSSVGGVNHYAISHSGSGIACVGSPITITAHDAGNSAIDAGGETINLSTSPGKGVWARVLNGAGSLTPVGGQSDNGLAQYSFAPGETSVTLLLNYTVPTGNVVPVNINVLGQTSTAVEFEDPPLAIAEAGLVFYNQTDGNTLIPTQIAGKPSSLNPLARLLTVQAVRSSDEDPMQCVPLFAEGQTLDIELAAECIDADECVDGELFSVTTTAGTTNIALNDSNNALGASAYTPVEMDFVTQTNGPAATIVINYSDAGKVQLHGRYNIPFGFFGLPSADNPQSAPGYSGDYIFGSSNEFVVRPFGFAIDFPGDVGLDRRENLPAGNFAVGNSLAADASGSVWKRAGEDFDVTVFPVRWEQEDDLNNDGVADDGANLHDNFPTPNFYRDTEGLNNDYRVEVSVISNQAEAINLSGASPQAGVIGELSDNVLDVADYDNAPVPAMPLVTMTYNEVGIIDLRAQLIDVDNNPTTYMGTDNVTGRTDNVGRFYPHRFTVDGAVTLLPRVSASCVPPSTFTYMGEPFGMAFVLTARNQQGDVTVNYRGAFAKLGDYAELNFRAIEEVADTDNINHSTRLQNATIPSNLQAIWSSITGGQLFVNGNLIFNRADPALADGPYGDMVIAFVPVDDDGVSLDINVLDTDIIENNLEFRELAREDFRYGRLLVNNAYGPETEDLAITLRVEYFDEEAGRFVLNVDDSCTVVNSSQMSLLEGTETGNLSPDDTGIVAGQSSTFHNGQIQGVQAATNPTDATLTATAAGLDNSGTIDIELDLSGDGLDLPFLQFKWPHEDIDYNENPRATIEFGQYRAHDRVIYWKEVYNGPSP